MNGLIKGWDFKVSADGSTTLDALKNEKSKLEAREKELPILIANLNNTIRLRSEDITWLKGLNNRKRKKWEKEKGKSAKEAIYRAQQAVVDFKAKVSSMSAELKRIPAKIAAIDKQMTTLIKGESTGLSKGLDKETAKALGELELIKEQQKIDHQQKINETQQAKAKAEKAKVEAEKEKVKKEAESASSKTGWIIGGIVVLLIVGIIIYKTRKSKMLPVKTLAL